MNASLHRTLHILAESSSGEEAKDTEWETRDEEVEPSDPENWEDVEPSYELDDEDWEALKDVVKSGSTSSLNEVQSNFLKEAGLIDGSGPTDLGRDWVAEAGAEKAPPNEDDDDEDK